MAEAELKANSQRAFADAESSARIDLLAARVEQKRAERDYARQLLARSEVRAERAGIAVFADAERLTGKPVQTGERLMQIADPAQAELRIELPVGDAIALQPGAEVALFLDSDPLNRHDARLERAAYEAQATAAGQLAYRLDAAFADAPPASACAAPPSCSVTARRWPTTCCAGPWPRCARAWGSDAARPAPRPAAVACRPGS